MKVREDFTEIEYIFEYKEGEGLEGKKFLGVLHCLADIDEGDFKKAKEIVNESVEKLNLNRNNIEIKKYILV